MKAGDVVECIEMDEDGCKANNVTLGKRYKVASSEDEDCDNELVFLVEDDAGLNDGPYPRGVYACRFKLVSSEPGPTPGPNGARITEVHYESNGIGVTVAVGDGSPELALEMAKEFVGANDKAKREREEVASQLREIASQLDFDNARRKE